MTDFSNVGFIGLGNIGKPMAKHLDDHFKLHVYDVNREALQAFEETNAICHSNLAELASACDYIGICVRDDRDVENVLYEKSGILNQSKPNTVIAIHSTVNQASLLKWANDAKPNDITLLDAPITGGAAGAEEGTLCYMVGSDPATLERCRPVWNSSAEKIIHAGATGSGIALKLCNNLITYAQFTAMSEATRLAEACGLSAETLREVGQSNSVINEQMYRFISGRNALAASGDEKLMKQMMEPMGLLGEKDLDCALKTAAAMELSLPATEKIRSMIADVFIAKA